MPKQPSLSFMLSHPAHLLSLGFGSGLSPKAPGTFGTLVGLPLYWLVKETPLISQWVMIAALFILGIYLCDVTGKALGVSDHGSIVWDEIIAMMLVLTFTPLTVKWWLIAFVLFRLFDIWKPYPIRQIDAKVKAGFGVMLDDLFAAIYAIGIIKLLLWIELIN